MSNTTTKLYTPSQALFRLDGEAFQSRNDPRTEFPLCGQVLSERRVREESVDGVQHNTELSTVSISSKFLTASVLRTLELSDVTDHATYGISPQIGEYIKEMILTQLNESGKEIARYHLQARTGLDFRNQREVTQELLEALVHADALAGLLVTLPKKQTIRDGSLYAQIASTIIAESPPTKGGRDEIVVNEIITYAKSNGFSVSAIPLRSTLGA